MKRNYPSAFTILELLIVVAIIALLIGLVLPALRHVRSEARSAVCLSNLKQIAMGFNLYAGDHDEYLPPPEIEGAWVSLLAPYAPALEVFGCPSDDDVAALGTSISYAWRNSLEVVDPQASLAGWNLGAMNAAQQILVFDAIPGWHGLANIQAASLDTSSNRYSFDQFQAKLEQHVR